MGGPESDRVLQLLRDLTASDADAFKAVKARYQEVTNEQREPIIFPSEAVVDRHILKPLREAKCSYVLGMPIACIAQAGLVAEMVVMWRYRMAIADRPPEEIAELVAKFDKERQDDRVRLLKEVDQLDEELKGAITRLRKVRTKYLHYMVDVETDPDTDAKGALADACLVVRKTIGVSFNAGALVLPDRVQRWIQHLITTEAPERTE